MIPARDFFRRVDRPKTVNEGSATDKESVVKGLKHILRNAVYEDCDFCITDKYIKVDLVYDSKRFVTFYQEQARRMFPKNARVRGTTITIYFGDVS